MAGRFAHFLVAGAAIIGGMAVQGDLDLGSQSHDRDIDRIVNRTIDRSVDTRVDRTIDRIVDRVTRNIDIRDGSGKAIETDPAMRRAMIGAVAELVRAEVSLNAAKRNDDLPEAAVEQAEQRRDLAREAVDRIADDTRASSRGDRDELRRTIRDEVRESVREAVRS